MKKLHRIALLGAVFVLLLGLPAVSQDAKPVKVYILSGQSNMVGIGQVDGGGSRWGKEFIDPVLSVYPGKYDPKADYDKMKPSKTLKLKSFGGVRPTPYPGGGVQIVRGTIKMKTTGVYEFRPGFGGSTENIMTVAGKEVYRKEPGQKKAKHTHIKLEAGKQVPFTITYLNDQANGLGWFARVDIPGTLKTLVFQDGKFPYLKAKDGGFASRDDVYYKGVVTATANQWLSAGCGANGNSIGPELGFGWTMGEHHDQPVLVLKASQGNRSLFWDFCPPGSPQIENVEYEDAGRIARVGKMTKRNASMFTPFKGFKDLDIEGKTLKELYDAKFKIVKHPKTGSDVYKVTYIYAGYKDTPSKWFKGSEPQKPSHGWYAGKQYDDCFNAAKDVLKNFDQNFPHWKGRGYEIAGFVWWQGHKDSGSELTISHYEKNLVRLVGAMRKEFNAPSAPVAIATIGFHGNKMKTDEDLKRYLGIVNAQLAVNDYDKYPQFAGNVKAVDIRGFWREAGASPRNQDFHYNGNAETYMLVGEALGKAMVELKSKKAE